MHSRNLEGVQCRSDMGILTYFIQNLNFVHEAIFKGAYNGSDINIFNIISLKCKFGQIVPKIKASLNLHEYAHTRQFEDSKCK